MAASAVVALVLLVSRLVARQTPRYVLSAVAATAVAAFFALRSGRAEDAFLPGILASAALGRRRAGVGRSPAGPWSASSSRPATPAWPTTRSGGGATGAWCGSASG